MYPTDPCAQVSMCSQPCYVAWEDGGAGGEAVLEAARREEGREGAGTGDREVGGGGGSRGRPGKADRGHLFLCRRDTWDVCPRRCSPWRLSSATPT